MSKYKYRIMQKKDYEIYKIQYCDNSIDPNHWYDYSTASNHSPAIYSIIEDARNAIGVIEYNMAINEAPWVEVE